MSSDALREMALVAIKAVGALAEIDMRCVAEEATAHATLAVELRAVVTRAQQRVHCAARSVAARRGGCYE